MSIDPHQRRLMHGPLSARRTLWIVPLNFALCVLLVGELVFNGFQIRTVRIRMIELQHAIAEVRSLPHPCIGAPHNAV